MKSPILAAATLSLGFSLLPLSAAQPPDTEFLKQGQPSTQGQEQAAAPTYNATLVMEYTLVEAGKVIARSVIHADPQDSSEEGTRSSSGTALLRVPGSGTWTIVSSLDFGVKHPGKAQDDYLNVEVNDLQKLQAPSGDSNTMQPVVIYGTERRYKGPGTYLLFEDNERKLSLTVTETKAAVEKEKEK
ncbi:hypothetical protein [Haloferula sp. BvORR071]|uniref:hypothetical protein n=1 Tax=Haloferula sp. BvORR071 TaxID=1396141 RepID=UPI00054DEA82|nr:hypothetical protein [Haloferula sp. BvORR071]